MTTFLANRQRRQRHARGARPAPGFTLIELLIVIAITAILLGLLFGPLIQSFNFTNRVRAQGAAQDAARFGLERIRRELSQATFVFDNSQTPLVFPFGVQQADPAAGDIIKTDRSGGGPIRLVRTTGYQPGEVPILFARVDFVSAAQTQRDNTATLDPTTVSSSAGDRCSSRARPAVVSCATGLACATTCLSMGMRAPTRTFTSSAATTAITHSFCTAPSSIRAIPT
jgi:prepilin-type N-terminal cleavage/methylation domain-containing protein